MSDVFDRWNRGNFVHMLPQQMSKVYQISKGLRLLTLLAGTLMIAAFVAGFVMLLLPDEHGNRNMDFFYVFGPLYFLLIFVMVMAMYNTLRGRIIIDDEKISSTGIPRRSLYFDQIKGFTIDPRGIINVVPYSKEHRKIRISAYTERLYELKN